MSTQISSIELGNRISILRKQKGFSQEELAKLIAISRSSLTQLEQGNRNISVVEIQKIAGVFCFSIDVLLSQDFKANDNLILKESIETMLEERISVPELNVNKFKNILLYILERCAGKPNVGETVLYKLLYFSDFNYYEQYEEHLTGANYRKLPYGPVPQKLDAILKLMIDGKQLMRIKTEYHNYPQTRYIPLEKSDLSCLKANEKETIDHVIEQMSDWSASAISAYSHKDIPWLTSQDGEEINYELVFYRESPFSVRNYEDEL
jgi:transcriptional regulator with XRE-family HTH domain